MSDQLNIVQLLLLFTWYCNNDIILMLKAWNSEITYLCYSYFSTRILWIVHLETLDAQKQNRVTNKYCRAVYESITSGTILKHNKSN